MKKHIRLAGVFSIATGAMISSGIFILPSLAFAQIGPGVSLAYLIAGIFAFGGCFSIIELATAMPKDGGDYYYIHKTFGGFIGSISGIFGWFALSLKSAFAIFGISEVLLRFFGFPPTISGLVLCAIFVLLNAFGTKEAVKLQNLLVFFLILLLILYSIFGILFGLQVSAEQVAAHSRLLGLKGALQAAFSLQNFSGEGQLLAILSISGFVFVSFGGLLKVANVSEEIAQPKRNLPLGMSIAILSVTVLYTAINLILVAVMPAEELRSSLAPVADSARTIMQNIAGSSAAEWAYYAVLLASLLAFVTTANAGIMVASRYPMALGRDKLLPAWIAKVHPRYQTPIPALLITGLIVAISLFLPLDILVKSASAVVLSSYILTNLAVIIFRESHVTNYRPSFSAPFYPWMQILCIAMFTFFIVDIGLQAIEVSIFFLAFSVATYYFYGRKHSSKSFALVHLLRRIVDRHLEQDNLEKELLDVLLHRDEIQLNIFQAIVQKAPIQDLSYAMTFPNMLKACCKDLGQQTGIEPKLLETRFLQRHKESSTVFSHFLAIPHFITESEEDLFMQVIRCKEGIFFDEDYPAVKAIFLLGGGRQRRHEHLQCLAAIATMVQEIPDLEERWLAAENAPALRNLLLNLGASQSPKSSQTSEASETLETSKTSEASESSKVKQKE